MRVEGCRLRATWARDSRNSWGGKDASAAIRQTTCLTQLTSGPCVVQIWSRYARNFDPTNHQLPPVFRAPRERDFFIDNLLVQIHFNIMIIRWTGLAPWEFGLPFTGSLTSTFQYHLPPVLRARPNPGLEFKPCLVWHRRFRLCRTGNRTTEIVDLAPGAMFARQRCSTALSESESGTLRAVHLSRHKWPGRSVH